jgi:hypothetical protein
MSIFGMTVQRTNLEIMSLLTTTIPGGIRIYIERSAMPRHRQPMPNTLHAMFTENSTFDVIFLDLWETSQSPTSSIQWKSACLITSRIRLSPSCKGKNGTTSTMQYNYPYLLTPTSHEKLSHMRIIPNGIERSWRKYAGSYLELWYSL